MNKFIIFDNGGKTSDRYTIINKETGDVFGSCENPDAPNGAGKFLGNCAEHRIIMNGTGWRRKLPGKKVIRTEVDNYIYNGKLDSDWLGKEVDFNNLPVNVRQYISRLDPLIRTGDHAETNVAFMAEIPENGAVGSSPH